LRRERYGEVVDAQGGLTKVTRIYRAGGHHAHGRPACSYDKAKEKHVANSALPVCVPQQPPRQAVRTKRSRTTHSARPQQPPCNVVASAAPLGDASKEQPKPTFAHQQGLRDSARDSGREPAREQAAGTLRTADARPPSLRAVHVTRSHHTESELDWLGCDVLKQVIFTLLHSFAHVSCLQHVGSSAFARIKETGA
jgi:hypothetical protein